MIVAEIYTQADGKIVGFEIDGHSNQAPRGSDIYCAGVSTVSQAAYMCIANHLKCSFQGDFASGKLSMRLISPPDDRTEAVFQTMLIGIREIEKIAPQAVTLTVKPEDSTAYSSDDNILQTNSPIGGENFV